jgi:3-oxoadipate enol-lactonase
MRVLIDDGELTVLDEGSGIPMVLLHGFPLAKETWDEQAAVLRNHARVVRIDLRGLGASRAGPGPYLMEMLAGDVAAVLDALGIERATIVGHSLGTYVAYAFFRMFEERVLGLGLVCGRSDADSAEAAARRHALAERAERDGMKPLADDYVPRYFAPDVYRERPELVERARAIVLTGDPVGAAALLRGMAVRVAADDLFESMHIPVMVVAGRADALVPLAHQTATASAIAGARLIVLETGHVPLFEAPAELAGALLTLAREVGTSAAGQ